MPMMSGMWGAGMGLGILLMGALMLAGLVVLVVLIWALVRWLSLGAARGATPLPPPAAPLPPPAAPHLTPLEALRERYARGEIDSAAFDTMVQRLLETEAHDGTAIPR